MKKLFLLTLFISINSFSQINVKTYIPENAKKVLPILKKQQMQYWSEHPMPESLAALAEHESCISLTHKKCWNPSSTLSTKRELGVGMFQLTKAYREDGSIRFDALTDLRKKHFSELRELSWDNIHVRPDLQITAMLLMSRDNYKALYSVKDPILRLHFSDAAYNGGLGGVNSDRRLCGLKAGCDPQVWFENVETTCSKSKKVLYANRNACDINRHHVYDVFNNRSDKYKVFMR